MRNILSIFQIPKFLIGLMLVAAFLALPAEVRAAETHEVETWEEFQDAISEVDEGGTIIVTNDFALQGDVNIYSKTFTITSEGKKTINCGGYRFYIGIGADVTLSGNLTISGTANINGNCGVNVEGGAANITGGNVSATERGIDIENGTANVSGGAISGAKGVHIQYGTANINVSSDLLLTNGVYSASNKAFLTELPDPVKISIGETETIQLNGVDSGISFTVHGDTSQNLGENVDENEITLNPTAVGELDLVLWAQDGNSKFKLIIPVTVETKEYTLSYTAGDHGSIIGETTQTVSHGGSGTQVTAVPDEGYHFVRWSDDLTSATRTDENVTGDISVTAIFAVNRKSSGGTGTPFMPTYKANISGIGTTGTTIPVNVNAKTGNATTDLGNLANDIFSGSGKATLTVPPIPDVNSYTLETPVSSLSGSGGDGALIFSTPQGSITIPGDMLAGVQGTEGKTAGITIGQGDKSGLPQEVQTAIGDRPLIQLTLTIDGKQTEWNNPDAPVTVAIPYTPTAAELENPESIVIWYIDGSGNVVPIPNGRYDAATGTVTFATTHFSYYAVSYKQANFRDVAKDAWYARAVSFIAARDITTGTGEGSFSPEAKLTRGQFIVMLMKAYGIEPDASPKDNFADAGSTWYTGYLAAAKRLGITAGVGNNMFAPEKEISRQEMLTLLYNVLKVMGQLPGGDNGKALSDYSDAEEIASWAKEAMTWFVKTGVVGGSDGKLSPMSTTTRVEMAQVLYNLLAK